MRSIALTIVFILSFVSCNSLFVQKRWQHATKQNIVLTSIGKTSGNLLTRDFQAEAFPIYNHPIKVSVKFTPFTRISYYQYKKATEQQYLKQVFTFDKKAKNKTYFLQLQLADNEQLITELNAPGNENINNWLKANPKAKIITGLSMYVAKNTLDVLKKADRVLLVNKAYKSYELECYKGNKKFKTISFSDGVVFGYNLSSFCWGQTRGINWKIKALTRESNSCNSNQYKSFNKAQKSREIDYKF